MLPATSSAPAERLIIFFSRCLRDALACVCLRCSISSALRSCFDGCSTGDCVSICQSLCDYVLFSYLDFPRFRSSHILRAGKLGKLEEQKRERDNHNEWRRKREPIPLARTEKAQEQRVGHDRYRRERHREPGKLRLQHQAEIDEHPRRDRDAHHVVEEREE